jgi:hypothetical protein
VTISKNTYEKYISQLTDKEKVALKKAKEILGDSFNIQKSLGFIKWISNNN